MLQFERQELERLTFVFETGGRNAKVTRVITGIESFTFGAILFNKIRLTAKGIVRVFGEDESYRGYIQRDNHNIPRKYKCSDEESSLKLNDFYTKG